MTPKELEDIRSWRRGEWVADITEIESMVYGLVDELDRLRAAAEGLRRAICEDNNAAMILRDINGEGDEAVGCYRFVLNLGRELGLFTDKP